MPEITWNNSWPILVGLRTQTQNAAFFERKGPKRKPWPRGKAIAMRFLNASVLERKALNRTLSWGFPLGNRRQKMQSKNKLNIMIQNKARQQAEQQKPKNNLK